MNNENLILGKYTFTISAENGKKYINLELPSLLQTPQMRNGLRQDMRLLQSYLFNLIDDLGEDEEVHEWHKEEFTLAKDK